MADTLKAQQVILKPVEIIGEAWMTFRKNWKLYLRWAAVPLLFFIAEFIWMWFSSAKFLNIYLQIMQLQHKFSILSQQDKLQYLQQLQQTIPFSSFMALPVMGLLGALIGICYMMRVYRHVLLGDVPDKNIFAQIFSKRPWLYLWKHILLGFKWWLFTILFMIAGFIVIAVLAVAMRATAASAGVMAGILVPVDIVIVCLVLVSGFMLIAEQFALIGPDVAVDGPASLSRLHRLAKQHRRRIFLTLILIAWAPILVHIALAVAMRMDFAGVFMAAGVGKWGNPDPEALSRAVTLIWQARGARFMTMYAVLVLFWLACGVMNLFVCAVIYKRLRPTWPAQEAAMVSALPDDASGPK